MTLAWYIDSLDARGGLAFVSFREPDLVHKEIDFDQPAIFLSAPGFEPEPLTSRALAFGAARGQAQLGVYLGTESGAPVELAFEDLDAVREFVRRAYLAGGGGDAGGGGGIGGDDGPPLAPDGEGPIGTSELERVHFDDAGEGRGGGVGRAADKIRAIASRLQFIAAQPTSSESFAALAFASHPDPSDVRRLVDGATELFLEILRRYPLRGRDAEKGRWARAARRLGRAISRLDFWPDILNGRHASLLDGAATRMLSLPFPHEPRGLLPFFFGCGFDVGQIAPWDYQDFLWWLSRLEGYGALLRWHHGVPDGVRGTDPIDDLCAWPVPCSLVHLIGKKPDSPSVFHLMSTCIADPARLSGTYQSPDGDRAVAIILFAAAHLQTGNQIQGARTEVYPDGDLAGRAYIADLARLWLLRQMPALVFPAKVETLIGEAADL